jgi:hypothetical protein
MVRGRVCVSVERGDGAATTTATAVPSLPFIWCRGREEKNPYEVFIFSNDTDPPLPSVRHLLP